MMTSLGRTQWKWCPLLGGQCDLCNPPTDKLLTILWSLRSVYAHKNLSVVLFCAGGLVGLLGIWGLASCPWHTDPAAYAHWEEPGATQITSRDIYTEPGHMGSSAAQKDHDIIIPTGSTQSICLSKMSRADVCCYILCFSTVTLKNYHFMKVYTIFWF